MTTEAELRRLIAEKGKSLYQRSYACGGAGNLSARLDDVVLMTPTGSSLGDLYPEDICKLSLDGEHLAGDKPTKESSLHLEIYRNRSSARGIVHLHSTSCTALSCLSGLDRENCLPPLTAYHVMRVGKLPLLPYFPPGDPGLAKEVGQTSITRPAMLLANHGSVVAAENFIKAVHNAEELEETAKLYFMLKDIAYKSLNETQMDMLLERFLLPK
jgi:ribulose-5-phosphate 4-epimerase/fuculose-1-phosphate aldolase